LAAQKPTFWRDFGQLRNLIANISGSEQDIVDHKKTTLQTAITPVHVFLIW